MAYVTFEVNRLINYSIYYIHVGKTTNQITEPMSKLFQGKNFAFVATLMKDGSPQITPTWIDLENNMILVNTAEDRVKHRNIVRDPRVAVSIIDQTNPYNMVTIQGKVIEQTTKGADEHIK